MSSSISGQRFSVRSVCVELNVGINRSVRPAMERRGLVRANSSRVL
jgi:hypothetical protein